VSQGGRRVCVASASNIPYRLIQEPKDGLLNSTKPQE
jgi:hypothetical protein